MFVCLFNFIIYAVLFVIHLLLNNFPSFNLYSYIPCTNFFSVFVLFIVPYSFFVLTISLIELFTIRHFLIPYFLYSLSSEILLCFNYSPFPFLSLSQNESLPLLLRCVSQLLVIFFGRETTAVKATEAAFA